MDTLSAILVDDETHCLETLQWQLTQYCPQVQVIASFTSSREALSRIPELKPDLLFMDIEMPYLNAFDLLNLLPKTQFHLIFTTAYNEYALKAFHFSALDYLLKPINKDELVNAVRKAWERSTTHPVYHQMEILIQQLNNKPNTVQKISLPTQEGLDFVLVKDIIRCQSDSNYSNIFLLSGKKLMVSRTLKLLEETLESHSFLRVHYSHLVNLQHIEKYIRGDGGTLIMVDGAEVAVARSRKEILLRTCKNLY